MRFNPPPNWPEPPADFTPLPGWEPDPSWPPMPPGWQLWVDEDEFVISPYRTAASRTPAKLPWYRQTATVVLAFIFLFPVGVALLWTRPDWSVRRRSLITAVGCVFVLIAVAGTNPPPAKTTTTALSPTTIGTTASPQASPSSRPVAVPSSTVSAVTPSTAPATTAPAAPATTAASVRTTTAPVHTSVAPVRTTAAPVHTTAAPARTTTAPQPVQSTAPKPSCQPLSSTGHCYKAGEFCSNADHNLTGTDANGNSIKCEDNDGWRWERI